MSRCISVPAILYPKFTPVPKVKPQSESRAIEAERIVKVICEYYGLTFDEIAVKNRKRRITFVRQALCYFLHYHGKLYKSEIGNLLNQHHTTVIFAIRKFNDAIETEYETRELVDEIKKKLASFED
jgi:chromosomal replication initiation ATPase DnaA